MIVRKNTFIRPSTEIVFFDVNLDYETVREQFVAEERLTSTREQIDEFTWTHTLQFIDQAAFDEFYNHPSIIANATRQEIHQKANGIIKSTVDSEI
jgi:hypothetical protein